MAEAPQPVEARRPEEFRNYAAEARSTVREFYRLNHTHQTLDFVLAKKKEYLSLDRLEMTVWEALEYLEQLVDDSDPDVDFTQIEHAMQTAEAIRAAGPAALVPADGPRPRPRQDSLHLGRAPVGGGRRHVPGGVRLLGEVRLSRVLRVEPGLEEPGAT